jgi:hypothetical protein
VYAFSTHEDPIADIAARSAGILRCNPSLLRLTKLETTETSADVPAGVAGDKDLKTTTKKKNAPAAPPADVDSIPCWGHVVRDVSPKKMMICLSFRLPVEVAMADPVVLERRIPIDAKAGSGSSSNISNISSDTVSAGDMSTGASRKRDAEGTIKSPAK